MTNKKLLIILLISVIFISGCSLSVKTKEGPKGSEGGVFLSPDRGENWKKFALVPTIKGAPLSISSLNVNFLIIDPQDSDTVYFGSDTKGLYYTNNILDGWNHAEKLPVGKVNSIAVDPLDKCTLYVAMSNKVYKSEDCLRGFSQVYFDNDPLVSVNSVAIDHYDSNKVFIGTSRGEVIKSSDKGKSWQTVLRTKSDVVKILLNPADSRIVFAGTESKGLFRSVDGGLEWLSLKENMEEFKNSYKIRDMAVYSSEEENILFTASTYGMLKSMDHGDTWSRIELITPEKDSTINSMTLNPKDSKEIYYVTKTTFYSSFDGGENWTTRKLPSSREGWKLMVNPDETSILYLGFKQTKKK